MEKRGGGIPNTIPDLSFALDRANYNNLRNPNYQRLKIEQDRFRIISPIIPFVDEIEGVTMYCFSTENGGEFFLRNWSSKSRLPQPIPSYDVPMKQFELDLLRKMTTKLPSPRTSEYKHNRLEYVVAANVAEFEEMIRGRRLKRTRIRTPRCISEVPLGEFGQADSVIIGSDWNIMILEYGNGDSKPEQVLNYVEGVRERFHRITGRNLPPSRVIPRVLKYHFNENTNVTTVDIYEPEQARKVGYPY